MGSHAGAGRAGPTKPIAARGDHWEIGLSLHNLAESLRELGEYARARELDEQALTMHRRLYASDHPDIARSLNNLAEDLRGQGDDVSARELDEQALVMRQQLADRDVSTA
ncbi:MAG TPA: tetratricopeptide repeat protein [Actinomycetota bacterium]|nr:tetratricopeptide repeat protein [Actinomycetota bacterium]